MAVRPPVISAIPIQRIPVRQDTDDNWWVPNLVEKGRFEAAAPKWFECCLCGDPALPFTVLTPCGHCCCRACAEDSTRCPQCERPIIARTVVRQIEGCVLSSLTFECKTRRCSFVTKDPHEAFQHNCGDVENLRSASQTSLPNLGLPEPRSSSGVDIVRLAPTLVQGDPSHLLSRITKRKTLLFWDFDSMQPTFYGMSLKLFYRRLMGCLVTSCSISSEIQSTVFCPRTLMSTQQLLSDIGCFVIVYPVGHLAETLKREIHQLIASALQDSITTMFDVVVVSVQPGFLAIARELFASIGTSPFFLHVVSDITALPPNEKYSVQTGAVTYIDVADFLKNPVDE